MLFKQAVLESIRRGEVKVAIRRWRRPTVRPGTHLHTPIGLLAIGQVEPITEAELSEALARRAGYAGLGALRRELHSAGQLYRITFRLAGADPRIALRQDTTIDDKLLAKLARLDTAARAGSWTERVLRLIAANPHKRAAELSAELGVEKKWLKLNVRKLKNLGLTESLGTGYRLSSRGRELLKRLGR